MRILMFSALLVGCEDTSNPHDHDHDEQELITAVELTWTDADGLSSTAVWSEDATAAPSIDLVGIGSVYAMDVRFLNELAEPVEDITVEVLDEADQHQVFFTGDAVAGPATGVTEALVLHEVLDTDGSGLPLGLSNQLTVQAEGAGTLTVTLRHLPPVDGQAVKVEGLAEQVAASGLGAIPGDTDVQVNFEVLTAP